MSNVKLKWLLPLIALGLLLGFLLSSILKDPAPQPILSQTSIQITPPAPLTSVPQAASPSAEELPVLPTAEPAPAQDQPSSFFSAEGTSFQLVEPNKGWLLTAGKLYWTSDNGGSWGDITPQGADACSLSGIHFANSRDGYIFCHDAAREDLAYTFYQTHDTGANWSGRDLNLSVLLPQTYPNPVEAIFMQWLDPQQGFVLFRLQAGTNFSLGYLFSTQDGGLNWQYLDAPSAEPFVFVNPLLGYQLDNPAHNALSATTDGGRTWQVLNIVTEGLADGQSLQLSLPQFNPSGQGWLTASIYAGTELLSSAYYHAPQAGSAWTLSQDPAQKSLPEVATVNENYTVSADGALVTWKAQLASLPVPKSITTRTAAFEAQEYALDFLSFGDATNAWGSFMAGNCEFAETPQGLQKVCRSQRLILSSQDAGSGWQMLNLPVLSPDMQVKTEQSALEPQAKVAVEAVPENLRGAPANITYIGNNRAILQEQGFDLCYFKSVAEMQTWMRSSPYWAVNLYIGGDLAACSHRHPDRDKIGQLYNQGWKFIPTWVGPQAPCTSYRVKFDYDTNRAYQQGVQNAEAAIARMHELGLLMPNGKGSVVYYDLESYATNSACTAAVQAFLRGWTNRLQQSNVTSGLYATGNNLNNSGAATINPAPQVVWPAAWYHAAVSDRYYDPTATVWNVPYVNNSLWANHQRIRQYEGGHTETWGGVSMNIDCNVIDGVVAVLESRSNAVPVDCSSSICNYLPIIGK